MDFSVKIEGLDKIGNATREVQASIQKEIDIALFASAKKVEAEAKRSITEGGKTGRDYEKYNPRRTHTASAPGEAPASDTGRLVNSITAYPAHDGESTVVAGRGTVEYASMLEFGTRKMAARPFMFPALEKSKDWIRERLAKAVRTAAIRSTRK